MDHHYKKKVHTKIIKLRREKRTSQIDFQTVNTTRKVSLLITRITKRDNKEIRDKIIKDKIKHNEVRRVKSK